MIAIIDYGAGNLRSVKKAFDHLKVQSEIITTPEKIEDAQKIVLPGVGAFGAAIDKLQESGFYDAVREWLFADKPFLGICLGMQMLLESSEEDIGVRGLSFLKGKNIIFVATCAEYGSGHTIDTMRHWALDHEMNIIATVEGKSEKKGKVLENEMTIKAIVDAVRACDGIISST